MVIDMKKISIAWGIVVVLICITLLYIGNGVKQERIEYEGLESDLKDAAIGYMLKKDISLGEGEMKKITFKELNEEKLISELNTKNDKCDGYVIVLKNNNKVEYTPYLECKIYSTENNA